MSHEDLIKHWFETANEDWETAEGLLTLDRRMAALFYTHIALEKYLKGLITKRDKDIKIPLNHNLLELSKMSGLELDADQLSHLTEINTFNIRARYDDFKRTFYNRATKEYTQEYFNYAKEFKIWLQNLYQNK